MERPQSILDIESQDPPPSYNSAIRTSFLLSTITTSTVEPTIPPNPVTSTSNPPYPVTPILNRPPYPVTPDFGQPPYPIPHEQDSLGPGSRSSMYESTEVPFPMPMPMLTPVRMPMPESPSFSSRNQNFVRLLNCEERTLPFALSPPVRNSIDRQSSVIDPLMRRKQIAPRRPTTSMTESRSQRKKEICISCCIILVVFNIVTVTVVLAIIWIFNYHKLRSF